MEVVGKPFYHIHRTNWRHSEEWTVGNTVDTIKHEFNYYFQGLLDEFHHKSIYKQKELHLIDKIREMAVDLDEDPRNLGENSISRQIQDLKFLNSALIDSLRESGEYLEQSLKVIRELLFEFVRRKSFPEHPSRLNCIWLCEKEEVDSWWQEFEEKEDKYIFEVLATGKIFKADGEFITHDVTRFTDFFSLATSYWNGDISPIHEKKQRELLFVGELRIISKFEHPRRE